MRVLYVVGHGTIGGVERHVETLLSSLPPAVEPAVCVLMKPGAVSDAVAAKGVPVYFGGARRGFDPRAFRGVRRAVAAHRPHVVHTHEMHTMSALAVGSVGKVVRVHTEHCSFTRGTSALKNHLVWRGVARRMDWVLGVSESTRQAIVQLGGFPAGRTGVLPNALDLAHLPRKDAVGVRRELHLPQKAHVIGGAGRLVPGKGWHAFLHVCAQVLRRRKDTQFVIVGEGPQLEELRELARDLEIDRHTHWLGWRDDALRLIGGMDVFLLTSKHETFGLTLLESLGMMTPVAGFLPEGGTEDILQHDPDDPPAVLLTERNPETLAEVVCDILDSEERADHLRERGSAVVRTHYDMACVAGRLVELYRRLMEEKGIDE